MMKKRIFSVLFIAVILFTVALLPVSAVSASDYVLDEADLFTDAEETVLRAKAVEYGEKQDCQFIFLTTADLEGYTAQEYADYAHHPSYTGYAEDSILFLIYVDDTGHGTAAISTHGTCIDKLSDSEQDEIWDEVLPMLRGRDYYGAMCAFGDSANYLMSPHLKWYVLPLSLVIGFVIALAVMSRLRAKLKTVSMQHGAANYVRSGSMNVTAARDTYLYSTVTRTEKPKDNDRSSTHSTGGSSFGGSSRDF